jgi:Secretion system C-terminal sorting domain
LLIYKYSGNRKAYRVGNLKTKIMKKLILLMTLCCWNIFLQAQQKCEDFQSFPLNSTPAASVGSWQMYNSGGVLNPPRITIVNDAITGSQIIQASDASGGTFLINTADYDGNWIKNGEKTCLCFDLKLISDGGSYSPPLQVKNSIFIFQNLNTSTNVNVAVNGATNPSIGFVFVLNASYNENTPWQRICLPINPIGPTDALPSNSFGQWVPYGQAMGGMTAQQAWNAVIQNVTEVGWFVDCTGQNQQEIIGLDNVCLGCDTVEEPHPTDQGAYCCEGKNLVKNGNFEFGNIGFSSTYTYNPATTANATAPGIYNVVNSAQAASISAQWQVKDHTKCVDSTAPNSLFMVINGKTQQASGTSSVIYRNTLALKPQEEYKLCLNLKNMPQCAFDVLPIVKIELIGANWTSTSGYSGNWITINTTNDPCDWYKIEGCIIPTSDKVVIKIHLMEDGNGDGNDLAIDDIAIQEKLDQNLALSVQHQGSGSQITGSVNTISSTDDVIVVGDKCVEQNGGNQYYWYVAEVSSISPLTLSFSTFAWSSNLGGYNFATSSTISPAWNLTTTFPGYTFQTNKLYIVGLYVPSCCESCYKEEWLHQLTFYSGKTGNEIFLTPEMKDQIKEYFRYGNGTTPIDSINNELNIYPNPSKNLFNVDFNDSKTGSYQLFDIQGKNILSNSFENKKALNIDLKIFNPGIYLLNIKSGDKVFNKKLIKE